MSELHRELRKPMSAEAIQAFEEATRPRRLYRDADIFDIGYEAAMADVRDRLSQITGVSVIDLTRGVY